MGHPYDSARGTVALGLLLTVALVALAASDGVRLAMTGFVTVDLLLRWAHFLAGIIWVGHNYANVIQRPNWRPLTSADLVNDQSPRFQALLNREHGVFRWASVVAWSAGMLMLWRHGALLGALTLHGAFAPIGIGAYIGTLMMGNVWFVLWPHQQKVLGFKPASVDERVRCSRITHLSSRTNTMLSIPLLLFMAIGAHGGLVLR